MASEGTATIVAIVAAATVIVSLISGITFYNTQELAQKVRISDALKDNNPEVCLKTVYMMHKDQYSDETTKRLAICRGYKVNLPAASN